MVISLNCLMKSKRSNLIRLAKFMKVPTEFKTHEELVFAVHCEMLDQQYNQPRFQRYNYEAVWDGKPMSTDECEEIGYE